MSKFTELEVKIRAGVATVEDFSAVKPEDVVAIKSDCASVRLRAAPTRKSADREARTVEHIASDETPDRMGDIIRVGGWKLDNFLRNPVLLRNHDNGALPLGLVTDVRKAKAEGRPALIAASKFFEDDKQNEEGRLIARLVLDGDLPAVSVGFMPNPDKIRRPSNDEERKELGVGEYGVIYEEAELLELSVVTVPANPAALMRRLDSMVEAGEVEKSLAAMVAKTFEPSSRVLVPVAKMQDEESDEEKPDEDEPSMPACSAPLERIERSLQELKDTFAAELAAVKAQLEIATRGVSSRPPQGGDSSGDTQTPAPDSRSIDPQAFFTTAFSAVLSRHKGAQTK